MQGGSPSSRVSYGNKLRVPSDYLRETLRRYLEDDSAASGLAIGIVAAQRGSAVYVPGRVQNYARFGSEAGRWVLIIKGVEHGLRARRIQLEDDSTGVV